MNEQETPQSVAQMIKEYLEKLFLYTAVHKKSDILGHIENKGFLPLNVTSFEEVSTDATLMVITNTDYETRLMLHWRPCSESDHCLNYFLDEITLC